MDDSSVIAEVLCVKVAATDDVSVTMEVASLDVADDSDESDVADEDSELIKVCVVRLLSVGPDVSVMVEVPDVSCAEELGTTEVSVAAEEACEENELVSNEEDADVSVTTGVS